MRTVEEIQRAITELSPGDLSAFRRWFEEFDATVGDRQLEEDVAAGPAPRAADEAWADLREGRTRRFDPARSCHNFPEKNALAGTEGGSVGRGRVILGRSTEVSGCRR